VTRQKGHVFIYEKNVRKTEKKRESAFQFRELDHEESFTDGVNILLLAEHNASAFVARSPAPVTYNPNPLRWGRSSIGASAAVKGADTKVTPPACRNVDCHLLFQ